MRRLQILALLVIGGVLVLAAASPSAASADNLVLKSSFGGSETAAGFFRAGNLGVNHETGNVLVVDEEHSVLDQFDSSGKAVNFSGTGAATIELPSDPDPASYRMAIDNTGGADQGNVYLVGQSRATNGSIILGFGPDGKPLPNFPVVPAGDASCLDVSPSGNLLVNEATFNAPSHGVEYRPDGTLTGNSFTFVRGTAPRLCAMALDKLGNLYLTPRIDPNIFKYDPSNGYALFGPTGDVAEVKPGENTENTTQIAIDPSNNDIFVDRGARIGAVRYSNPLVTSAPFEKLVGLSSGGLAFDATGQTLYVSEGEKVDVFHREPPTKPSFVGPVSVDQVRSVSAAVHGEVESGGGETTYQVEFGTDTSYGNSYPVPGGKVPFSPFPVTFDGKVEGLKPGTTYHLRLAITNAAGTTYGPDQVINTFPPASGATDLCPNALARKQTGAQALLDCRAYELVSAANTGGYDVESSLTPGQSPFGGYPDASGKILYGVHAGAIPGPWNPTNHGVDPYLATRGEGGWFTEYVGIPADVNAKAGPFSSSLGEANSQLNGFAFAGSNLCSPCFSSGLETGIPLHLPSGQLVQGMAGSLDPGVASAKPEGKVAKYFSADGSDLVFASKYAFEPGANDNGSDLTIYERDLATATTQIASTTTSGATLMGAGISELDISNNGSRIVFAQKVSADTDGNEYVHPYMHLEGSADSVDLAPGSTSGVLYDGMSADGSKVFFTTTDKLLSADTDSSADVYAAEVDSSGNVSLSLVSAGNSTSCDPVSNPVGEHWNTVGSSADCGAVAISGGGGVASASGDAYFLSPELLDGSEGTLNQPNLYRAAPGGAPSFVATLEAGNPLVVDSVKAAATRKTGDFQTTPSGGDAVFVSDLPLTGVGNFGFHSVFRYDAGGEGIACLSCNRTGVEDSGLAGEASLAPNGLSITADGRVFFDTTSPLVINDTNGNLDVYEFSNGTRQLISAGTSPFDSALLSVSADGTDAYFFTHDTLAPEEDRNGSLAKIYDARAGGGFFKLPAQVPCAASDECHGPGTAAPPAADIKSSGKTTDGNVSICRKGRVKKRGECVKAKHRQPKKAHAKKRGANINRKRGASHA